MEYSKESLTELIFGVINNIFTKIFNSVDNTVYDLLDNITFVDKDIIEGKTFVKMFGQNSQNGILLIANSLLLGFFIYYAFTYLMSHLTYKQTQKPSQFFFKALIFVAVMNSSLWFCQEIINIVSLITRVINSLCYELFNMDISFTNLNQLLNESLEHNDLTFDLFSFNGLIKTFSSVGMMNLILTYALRYVMIQIMVLLCPFAILTMLNEGTERLFKSWLRNFVSILLVQIVLALMIFLIFSFDGMFNKSLQKILYVAGILAITRINHFMKELIGGITFDVKQSIGMGVLK